MFTKGCLNSLRVKGNRFLSQTLVAIEKFRGLAVLIMISSVRNLNWGGGFEVGSKDFDEALGIFVERMGGWRFECDGGWI